MRTELTVRHEGRCTDVALATPVPVSLGAIRAQLAELVGIATDAELWNGGRRVLPAALFGGADLLTGSVLDVGRPSRGRPPPGVLALHQVGGPGAGRVIPLGRGRLRFGRDADCDVVLSDGDASREHAVIEVSPTAITVLDSGSTNGTLVDSVPVGPDGVDVAPGQLIRIGDSTFAVTGPSEVPAALAPSEDGTLRMLRPPRSTRPVIDREIAVPVSSSSALPRGVQWVTALLPAIAGGAIAWFTHSPQFLLFALLSPVMMVSSSLGDRVHWRRSRRRDAALFTLERLGADGEIAAALLTETSARRMSAPDPASILRTTVLPGSRLWERRRGDADLLAVRLGTADLHSTLRCREGPAVRAAGLLSAVPFCVDLRDGPLGITGPAEVISGLAHSLVGQLAALHSPTDLSLSLLLCPSAVRDWHWARWLPHLEGRVAACEKDWSALVAALAAGVEQRLTARRLEVAGWSGPWQVLIIDRAARLAELPGLATLLAKGRAAGLTALCLDEDDTALPTSCRVVARVTGTTGTRASVRVGAAGGHTDVVLDRVYSGWAETLARGLAPIVDAGADGSATVPSSCRLLETLGAEGLEHAQVINRWRASTGAADTVIGMCAEGPFRLDLVADGPHALIAGTTGAGKSELLQTLVAGLAANHPPELINFLLIDYKGGAAFGECSRLPHTAGLVTDLDPYLTARALRSLESELRRRERLFAAVGAVDLAGYRATSNNQPLARLIIVVDEFASLADELPDFVRGLVGVAQRGRSLGVHLVLATQRPGSAVSAEIRANTTLRISLRVTDAGESNDVIAAPDAASIEQRQPGRGYLRSGSVLTCFQTAHAGAADGRPSGTDIQELGDWRRTIRPGSDDPPRPSELVRLVLALRAAAERDARGVARSPWLAPLPDRLSRLELPTTDSPDVVHFAAVDLPGEQRRDRMSLDLRQGSSLLIAGSPRSGRSALLTSIVLGASTQLAPSCLQVYVIDASGGFADVTRRLPHAATVIGPDDAGLAPTLLRGLARDCARLVGQPAIGQTPVRLLLIDSWDALAARLGDAEIHECVELLAALLRAGASASFTTVVTGDRTTLAPRFAGGFAAKVVLRLADRHDFGLAGISPRDVPTAMPPGRGLRASDGAVLHVAHAGDAPDPGSACQAALDIAARWPSSAGVQPGPRAIRIAALPKCVAIEQLPRQQRRLILGVGGDGADTLSIDLFAGARQLLIAGPPRSGRSTALRTLLVQAVAANQSVVVAATSRSPLAALAARFGVRVVRPDDPSDSAETVPSTATLLLVDDCEAYVDSSAGEMLSAWVRASDAPLAVAVAGRSEDLAISYRGIGAQVRRGNCGVLLRPGPVDGDILGVRLPRRQRSGPPGRGVLIGDPAWGPAFGDGEPMPIQLACFASDDESAADPHRPSGG